MSGNNKPSPPANPGVQQAPFDVRDAVKKACSACGSEFFTQAYRMGVISHLAPRNTTRQDIPVNFATFVCMQCGHEFNAKDVPFVGKA